MSSRQLDKKRLVQVWVEDKNLWFNIWMVFESESEVAQLCPPLCDPMDCSLPGSSIPGILQARTLEWVAISFSNAGKWKGKVKSLSHVRLFETPWTAAHQAPPSMGFSRQEYWSGVPLPSPHVSTGRDKTPLKRKNTSYVSEKEFQEIF